MRRFQGAGDFLDLEALDEIANLDVVVILEPGATLVPFTGLSDFVLETTQGLQGALVNNHVVPQQPHLRAAADIALGHETAGDLADLGDVEDLANFRVAQELFLQIRR